jgi:uroporphyrinogen-III synthase
MSGALSGKRILVTRPKRQAGELVQRIRELGGEPIVVPAISVAPPVDPEPLDDALRRLDTYDWVIFTSANGVRAAAERMADLRRALPEPTACRLGAIGPATARALADWWRPPDVVPASYISDAIADVLGDVAGLRILLPRADIARRDLPIELTRRGAVVDEVCAYRIECGETGEELRAVLASSPDPPDFITLTSPSAVRGIVQILQSVGREDWMRTSRLVCIGPITARAVEELGLAVARVAREYTAEGLLDALLREE